MDKPPKIYKDLEKASYKKLEARREHDEKKLAELNRESIELTSEMSDADFIKQNVQAEKEFRLKQGINELDFEMCKPHRQLEKKIEDRIKKMQEKGHDQDRDR